MIILAWIYGIMCLVYFILDVVNYVDGEGISIELSDVTNILTLLAYISSFPSKLIIYIFKLIAKALTCDFR